MQFRYLGEEPLDVDVIHQANQQITRLTIPVSKQPITTNDEALVKTIFAEHFKDAKLFEKIEEAAPEKADEPEPKEKKDVEEDEDTASAHKRSGKK